MKSWPNSWKTKWDADCTVAIEECSIQSRREASFVQTRLPRPDRARFPCGPNRNSQLRVVVYIYIYIHVHVVIVIVSPITNFPCSPSKPTAQREPKLRPSVKAQPKCRRAISRTPFSRLSVVSKSRSLSLANRSTTYKCPRSRTRDGPSIDSAALRVFVSKKKYIRSQ